MKVRTLMAGDVIATDVGESVREAARRMRSDGISALPVLRQGELVGIITERDVVAALVDGLDPRTTLVAACMTPAPAVASPDEQVSEAAFRMVDLGIRHLPVVEAGRLVGMLSARDLLALDLLPER